EPMRFARLQLSWQSPRRYKARFSTSQYATLSSVLILLRFTVVLTTAKYVGPDLKVKLAHAGLLRHSAVKSHRLHNRIIDGDQPVRVTHGHGEQIPIGRRQCIGI